MKPAIKSLLSRRVLLFDGAMGAILQQRGIGAICNEYINITSPVNVADIHKSYLEAGCDLILTNSFGASPVVLAEHGLAAKAKEINFAAADIAKSVASVFSCADKPRFVVGDLGPTSKLPTLGHISFDKLFDSYSIQIDALMEGGVDAILIETCQDILQTKTAAAAAHSVFKKRKKELPLFISVTLEKNGTMLLGTSLTAALAAIAPYKPIAFGINCALGPELMEEHLKTLSAQSPFPIICQPNAGIPEIVDSGAHYPLKPGEFADLLAAFAQKYSLSFLGGCCGTTPAHIETLAKELALKNIIPNTPAIKSIHLVSSLFSDVAVDQIPRPFIIAEQTNVNGSKKFKELLLANQFDEMADVAKQLARASHALDINLAYPGRSEETDFGEFVKRIAVKTDAALMIDSTNPLAAEAALKLIPGRSIINSINLEDGGEKARRMLYLARQFGSMVVALTIDESGMTKTVKEKLNVAKRIVDLVEEYGLTTDDIFIDLLTFTLASGDASLRDSARQTLDAIPKLKEKFPGIRTLLGVSNISYGLIPVARKKLTSVFLHMAIEAGLDAAIINPAKIAPVHTMDEDDILLCKNLINNDASAGDPLAAIINKHDRLRALKDVGIISASAPKDEKDRLRVLVLDGSIIDLEEIISELLKREKPETIINSVLLPAMQEVGNQFGQGWLPLPFVLQSAEVMRKAIDIITPHIEADTKILKGTLVIATVRGDVHDIGKNLVDAIISNNGFKVINLGIKQPPSAVIKAAIEHNADAIGLSALLVSSTQIMLEDLATFKEHGLKIPILCGGAALNRSFVEEKLAAVYSSKVYYCPDAFVGLNAMQEISEKVD